MGFKSLSGQYIKCVYGWVAKTGTKGLGYEVKLTTIYHKGRKHEPGCFALIEDGL